ATWNFHGFVTNQELMNQYKILGVNLFMTVSQTEGLPVSVLEAFSCGIPVIATAVGGIPEAVQEEKTGHLLASNPTAIEVANIVSRFWNSSTEVKEKLSGNAYEFWKSDFQAKKNAENFCRTIQRIFK
ncbi:MAG: glycosyltransferase, partial [Ruthenibacterium sp.]